MHNGKVALTVLIALVAMCQAVPAADLAVPRRTQPSSVIDRRPPPPETPQQLFDDFLRWLKRQ
jgi:hypothetical protein